MRVRAARLNTTSRGLYVALAAALVPSTLSPMGTGTLQRLPTTLGQLVPVQVALHLKASPIVTPADFCLHVQPLRVCLPAHSVGRYRRQDGSRLLCEWSTAYSKRGRTYLAKIGAANPR